MKKTLLYFLLLIGSYGTANSQTVVTFYTTLGDFEVELYDAQMPITVGNFLSLVDQEFYDGIIFHRVIKNFVIQGGDPTGTGSGGPGYTIPDEFVPGLSNVKKTLSMANTGQPNSGGSQFFINLKDNIFLDYDKPPLSSAHPVFGIVISGWDIVELIENVPVNGNDRPLTPVVMNRVRVTQPLSINDLDANESSYTIYPNPAKNQFTLYSDASLEKLTIYDMRGRMLSNVDLSEMSREKTVDISSLASGVYIVRITGNEGSVVKNLVKQ
ncbi:peptidyl-prolyl cis-trans isomerase (rotamase) - cyclophilin family [Aequorivita sublithincola DSM 14238]|uniref:Peptidyl-prolyl cis-trans isomerase n=1 Tax=Aequorivita sublithincola (strain DSM 14238 / LMG 21431 / ACAM 643 / 9-3) TaxID=746697 RepID=I3YXR5_AEQSU|nr:peptidylprolyl isomerase [Aequorivita sublithincola]AFL81783.1 peptidyl-prolyl cis-trans isomerase (rotamase) - cyclophilin family [Aequorivita sublithincola DSM 14238]